MKEDHNDCWSPENMLPLVKQANEDVLAMNIALNKTLIAYGWKREAVFHNLPILWSKQLPDGRTVLVERDTAVRFEEFLQSYEANQ